MTTLVVTVTDAEGHSATASTAFTVSSAVTYGIDANVNSRASGWTLQESVDEARTAFGTVGPRMKFFDGGGGASVTQSQLASTNYGAEAREITPVLCFKTISSAAVDALITYALTRFSEIFLCFYQEVEDDIDKGTTTLAAYRAGVTQLAGIIAAHPLHAQVKQIFCANVYTEETSPTGTAIYSTAFAGLPFDAMGVDFYDYTFDAATWNPANLVPAFTAAAKTMGAKAQGLPWYYTELGTHVSTKTTTDTAAAAATRLQEAITAAQKDPTFMGGNYWVDPVLWPLIGTPSEPVWAAVVSP